MNSVLIVEDEKLIRQGIRAMAERAPVRINSILEARNGEEALDILKTRTVDVMLTDIRMPKMNGIMLVRELHKLADPPLTVVISGYDDFAYAVDMLREGVRDYLLKPVEREQIFDILKKFDDELNARLKRNQNELDIGQQVLRSLLRDEHIPDSSLDAIKQRYDGLFFKTPYAVVCMRGSGDTAGVSFDGGSLRIADVDGQNISVIRLSDMPDGNGEAHTRCAGFSGAHTGFEELRLAYREAAYARRRAFACGKSVRFSAFEPQQTPALNIDITKQLDIIVQLLGASNEREAKKLLGQLLTRMQNGQLAPEDFMDGMELLITKISETYRAVLPEGNIPTGFMNPLAYENALEYYTEFCGWMDQFCCRITGEFEDYQNKIKITQAVRYINDNYRRGLNMAMVSNHVSMNYSLFSHLFKQYTGNNFVSYLQTLRIDESKKLLSSSDMRVNEISACVGFHNEKHFMKLFKATCGVSPGEFRKNSRLK